MDAHLSGMDGVAADAPEVRKVQRRREAMILVSATNYLAGAALLALYAAIGSVGWQVPALYALITLGASAGFLLAVRLNLNLRLADPGLFGPQIAFAAVVLFSTFALVPQLAFAFTCNLFVTAAFGMVQFTERVYRWAMYIGAVAAGLIMMFRREDLALPASNDAEVAVLWVYLIVSLARFRVVSTAVNALKDKLKAKNTQLQASLEQIQQLANRDSLTGALVRRRFLEDAEAEMARAQRRHSRFCLVLLDIDHFKRVNDTHGHQAGDAVLVRFCDLVRGSIRNTDVFARYGGEEFILLLPDTELDDGLLIVSRVLHEVRHADWQALTPGRAITASAGVACWSPGEALDTVIAGADSALYAAKREGRDRVVLNGDSRARPASVLMPLG